MAVCPHLWGEPSSSRQAPTQATNKQQENVSLLCEGWKSINHVLFSTQLQRTGEAPTTRVLGFGAGWERCALAVSWGQFGKALPERLPVWRLSQSHSSLKCVLSREAASSKLSKGNEKFDWGTQGFQQCCPSFFLLLIRHPLGFAQQCEVVNHWAGRNRRVHG